MNGSQAHYSITSSAVVSKRNEACAGLSIRNEAGEVIRWFGTNTDVTEQIEAENAARSLADTVLTQPEQEQKTLLPLP